jgi:hypothetical protein
MRNIDRFISELKQLNLPIGEYVIVSSGPLAIRNIRECSDLDVLVSNTLFENFSQRHEILDAGPLRKISIGNIDLLNKPDVSDEVYSISQQIADAEVIEGVPFQKLDTCIYFKKKSAREKDLRDLELIEEYFKSNKV